MRIGSVVVLLSCLMALPLSAIEAPLPRHPAPSPDGSQILFSWQGDLWIVAADGGQARRLTAHPANERYPVWSRDGRSIAFSSDRYGSPNVFVMPADGSAAARRLTYFTGSGRRVSGDTPVDFTVDGSAVIFLSHRAETIRRAPGVYRVPLAGGTPVHVQNAHARWAAMSPDGEAMAFVRGVTPWTRRGYTGAANRDLWLRTNDGEFVQLTTFEGDDDRPSWVDGHTLAMLSARDGRKNVNLFNLVTGEASALSHHEGSDVRAPRSSADGTLIAYEFEDAIWTVQPSGGEPTRLSIDTPPGEIHNPIERRTSRDDATELAISPDGSLAAFVVHGEIFVTEVLDKDDQELAPPRTVQVTATPHREYGIGWAPDGESLVMTSSREGSDDLYLVRPKEADAGWIESFEFPVERLTDTDAEEHSPIFSPDGNRVAFLRNKGDIVLLDLKTRTQTVILEHWSSPDFDWSPDGQWLAYSVPDVDFNSEIWVAPVGGGDAYNVSRHPDLDQAPRWSPDGRRLVWLSRRHADTFDVWGVWLNRADDERTLAGWRKLWADDGRGESKGKKDKKSNKAKEPEDSDREKKTESPEVTIEFDRLWERARAVTSLEGREGEAMVSPDGRTVLFTAEHEGERDLYSVRFDGENLERLTTGDSDPGAIQFADDGKTVFYLDDDGRIERIGLSGKKGDPVPFTARYVVDLKAERASMFDEAWRALNENFYDPDFHGVDWQAAHRTYRPWALAASSETDFGDVVNLLLGELNASHMGYRPQTGRPAETTGWLGVTFDPEAGGPGLLVTEVLRDSPADRADVGIVAGERLLAIDGTTLETTTNVHALLADTVRQKIRVEIRGIDGTTRLVVIKPIGFMELRDLRYAQWVQQRADLVESWSGGRLGYLHIQSMDMPSYEEFERQLFAAGYGKEGLLIDVRTNGGGWTTDYLMAALNVRRHAFTVPRDEPTGVKGYPQGRLPLAAWTKPALTLCNEESYSNAEIFTWAFQTLERGQVVGTPTFGAVISTGGMRLLNGALVRLPFRGWYVAGSDINMELNGAVPDIIVEQPPEQDTVHTEDAQLQRAVEVMLEGLEEDSRHGAW